MKHRLFAAIAVFYAACNVRPEDPPVPTYDAATFYETTSIIGASFSADESRLLVSTD